MNRKIFFTLLCICLIAVTSLVPSTMALALTKTPFSSDFPFDTPVWTTCSDGAVISEHLMIHVDDVPFVDDDGNIHQWMQTVLVEGGLTDTSSGAFLPYKHEKDKGITNGNYYAPTEGQYMKVEWHISLLTLPGYGRVYHWTGHWVYKVDSQGMWNVVFQSSEVKINYDAVCTYFGH